MCSNTHHYLFIIEHVFTTAILKKLTLPQIPDVSPEFTLQDTLFSMTAGDFLEVYADCANSSDQDDKVCFVSAFVPVLQVPVVYVLISVLCAVVAIPYSSMAFLTLLLPSFTQYDVVVTCFFIDTAHNVLEYLTLISKLLKSGGRWINLGPLQYHFAGRSQFGHPSIELSWNELKRCFSGLGLLIEHEEWPVECGYTVQQRNMAKHGYDCVYSVCKKA